MTDLRSRHITLPALAASALFAAACSSSDSSTAPDTTAPTIASVVQDRGADPTGQTIAVTFSEAITAATAEVTGNYTVNGGATVTAATLRVDGRTVDLTLDTLAIPGTATVDIAAGIEDAAGNTSVAAAGQTLTSTDTDAPTAATLAATAVTGANNDQIVVTFDDDMIPAEVESLANWTVESPVGTTFDITGASVTYDAMTRVATVTLGPGANDRDLTTGASMEASFQTMRDVAGNAVTATTIGSDAVSATVDGDAAPPTLLSVAPGAGNTALLTFTEEVKRMETADLIANQPIVGTRIVLTDASDPGVQATGSVTFTGIPADGDSITLDDGNATSTFEFELGATGSVTLSDLPNDQDSVTIGDGNTSVTFEFDTGDGAVGTVVLIGLDAAATAGNLITAISGSALTVTAAPGPNTGEVTLRNAAGGAAGNVGLTSVNTAGFIAISGMTGGGVTGGNVAVTIDPASAGNTAGNLVVAIDGDGIGIDADTGGSAEVVTLENDVAGPAGNTTITETDTNGVLDLVNLSGGIAPGTATYDATASTTTTPSGSPFQAEVTFGVQPAAGDTILVIGTTDLAGNQMFPITGATLDAAVGTPPVLDTGSVSFEIQAGERNDFVTVPLDQAVHPRSAEDISNFGVQVGPNSVDLTGVKAVLINPTTVELRLDDPAANIQSGITYIIEISNLVSAQGVEMIAPDSQGGYTPVGDTTAPTVGVSDARLDPANANALLVTFNEAVSTTGATDTANYTIGGRVTNAAAMVTPRVVRLTFDTQPAISDNLDITAAALTDLAGNAAGATATVAVAGADATAPTVASVTAITDPSSADRIEVAFDEPVVPAEAIAAANYTVTIDGAPVALTDAIISYSSVAQTVTMDLPMAFTLTNGATVAVTPAGINDPAGNTIVAAASNAVVIGDALAPAAATGFVNLLADGLGTIVDVDFGEPVTAGTAGLAANWASDGGQTATDAMVLESGLVRVTFDGPIGPSDSITATNIEDLAGNAAGPLTFDPVD